MHSQPPHKPSESQIHQTVNTAGDLSLPSQLLWCTLIYLFHCWGVMPLGWVSSGAFPPPLHLSDPARSWTWESLTLGIVSTHRLPWGFPQSICGMCLAYRWTRHTFCPFREMFKVYLLFLCWSEPQWILSIKWSLANTHDSDEMRSLISWLYPSL